MNDLILRGRKALKRIQQRNKEEDTTIALLGRIEGEPHFDVTGKPGWVHVRIKQSNGAQTTAIARNDANVPHILNLPVQLEREYYVNGTFVYVLKDISRRADLAYSNPAQDPNIHTHDDRYFRETEVLTAADLGAPADTDKFIAVRAGGLGSILWSGIKTALNALYVGLTGDQTVAGIKTFTSNLVASVLKARTSAGVQIQTDDGFVVLLVNDDGQIDIRRSGSNGNMLTFSDLSVVEAGLTFVTGFRVDNADPDDVSLTIIRDTTLGILMRTGLGGESFVRFLIRANGDLEWGPGSATRDTDLYRNDVAQLKTDGSFVIAQPTLGSLVHRLQSVATNDDPTQDVMQGRIATTNATVTTLQTIAIPASHACHLEARVTARRTGGAAGAAEDCAGYIINGLFNQVAGAANIVGQATTVIGESQAGWDAVFDVTGTDARVRVTGAASNNITWHVTTRHWFLSS